MNKFLPKKKKKNLMNKYGHEKVRITICSTFSFFLSECSFLFGAFKMINLSFGVLHSKAKMAAFGFLLSSKSLTKAHTPQPLPPLFLVMIFWAT